MKAARARLLPLFLLLLLLFGGLPLLLVQTAGAGPGAVDLTPTPSVTPWVDPFSAVLTVTAQQQTVPNGGDLQVTIELDVVEGCQYPVFELTLLQEGAQPAFIYIDPPAQIVGPPLTFPVTYRLRAVRPGEITFRAQTFGERYCDDYWNWRYLYGQSAPVLVQGGSYAGWLPLIGAK